MLGFLTIFVLVMRGLVGGSGEYACAYPSTVTGVCLEFPLFRISPLTSISFPHPTLAPRFWLSLSRSKSKRRMFGVLLIYGAVAGLA